ncbi:hypothetical protein UlMin_003352 [Ulmus minor]
MEILPFFPIFYTLFSLPNLRFCDASTYFITPTISIADDNTTMVSSSQMFELGFFSPGSSKNRYLGIWYKATPDVVVWVANRNNPLQDSSGELTFGDSGNLILVNRTKSVIWSSNSSNKVSKDLVAGLLDSGNFVLREKESKSSEAYLWQSFDYPTDTLLAGMKMGWDLKTGHERYLTSWKSSDDPSNGDCTYRMSINGLPQVVLASGSTKKFRTGTWNGVRFSGQNLPTPSVFKIIYVFDKNEAALFFESTVDSVTTRVVVNNSGTSQRLLLHKKSSKWSVMYTVPYDLCESYGYCGTNALCKSNANPICECFQGFEPKSPEEWKELNWVTGCKRKKHLDCEKGEGFVKLVGIKLPDLLNFWLNENISLEECEKECLKNCSCTAYTNSDVRNGGSGCLMWFGDLIDVREMHVKNSEQDIHIRLSASEIKLIHEANKKRKLKRILVVSITIGVCILGVVLYCIFRKSRRKVRVQKKDEDIELPLLALDTIVSTTNNFSPANMIGEGGFGPVYKGKLSTGQDIAIKRLSKNSGQGLKEFKNEVELIAKLQHRNLVALLGCCIEREERMLIYEYMPNKSLDHFIFDRMRSSTILSWEKHFDIVMGIARGLLYLHRDSKLHIIHRDLKASNILLDKNHNPKISDFGLARIFEDDENEAKTMRVVGTYGYMSPEYATDGNFSVKSDVYSFGVLLLEIISGKKNRGFYHQDHHHNLLGHAWLLWNENKALEVMDKCFKTSSIDSQVLRCIQVGLLCVQKFPQDRPTMPSVVFMLENDEATLPQPKEPGFFTERGSKNDCSTSRSEELYSENIVTITVPNGR